MPCKPKPLPDNPEQFKRFIDMAREVEADDSPDALDRAFDKVISSKEKSKSNPSLSHSGENREQRSSKRPK
jgi:hypothetical protein